MQPSTPFPSASFNTGYFPLHLALLSCGENMMPMGNWTVISKEPFRFLIAMQLGNYTLGLLRKYGEAALHFMPWSDRQRVVRAGYLSGSQVNKRQKIGFTLRPAEKLVQTKLVDGADIIFETVAHSELPGLSREFALFVLEVVHTHCSLNPAPAHPLPLREGLCHAGREVAIPAVARSCRPEAKVPARHTFSRLILLQLPARKGNIVKYFINL